MKFASYNIVFQEIPDEVTLAVNISGCPNRCEGCHSPHLQEDTGEVLDENVLSAWLESYGNAITCFCFMGGDAEPHEVGRLASYVKKKSGSIKTAWYSGKAGLPADFSLPDFNYIKLGAYMEHLGGLNTPTTNQRFYRIENGAMIDITSQFYKQWQT